MNTKTTLGLVLTTLGIIGVIYPLSVLTSTKEHNFNLLVVYAVIGVISVISGITMVKTTQDA